MDPSQAGRVAGAVAGVGRGVAELGSSMTQVAGQMRRREEIIKERDEALQRSVTAIKVENELSDELDQIEHSYIGRKDYWLFMEEAESALDAIYPKYMAKAGDDQKLSLALDSSFSTQKTRTLARVRDVTRQVTVEVGQGEFEVLYEKAVNNSAIAGTDEERAAIKNLINLQAEIFAGGRILSSKAVAVYMDQFDDRVGETYVNDLIDSGRAAEVVKLLNNKEFLPNLDPRRRGVVSRRAEAKVKIDNETDRAKQETHVFNRLVSRLKGSPRAMREALYDPEVQREFRIDGKQVKNIAIAISAYEKVQNDRIDRRIGGYILKHSDGKLTEDEILSDAAAWYKNPMEGVDPDTTEKWLKKVREKDQETDPQIFNSFHDGITRKDPGLTRGVIAGADRLSNEEKKYLVTKFNADVRRGLNGAEAQGKLTLKLEIFGSEEIVRLPDPGAPERLRKAYLISDEWLLNFIKEGKVWDNVAAKEYSELISRLGVQFRHDAVEAQRNMIEKTKKQREGLRRSKEERRPRTIDEYERSKRAN